MRDQVLQKKRRQENIRKVHQAKERKTVDSYSVKNVRGMFELEGHNECYIVGGGPSLKQFNWDCLKGKFVIAINRSYEVLPDAQILYFTDNDYWVRHKEAMLRHGGKLFRGVTKFNDSHPKVTEWFLTGEKGLESGSGKLRHGRNSTYAAINLAGIHLEFKKIYLLGIDMQWGKKGDKKTSHWHDGHKRVDSENIYKMMSANFVKVAPQLKQKGIEVVNVNTGTSLKAFPTITYEDLFGEEWKK